MTRLIDADALKKRLVEMRNKIQAERKYGWEFESNGINAAIFLTGCEAGQHSIDAEQWHVIKKRPMTNDERIEWSEEIGHDIEDEDAFIYFNLPDDGEEVLVSTQFGFVYVDTFCQDEGCYFEDNGDMEGIVAWMKKPKPYEVEDEKTD